ncbi:MAG: hypothetical protein PHG61_00160 [Candidatus Marinimicrobia bacterium]|nr:hypothetical protein [Candidatus Neomarinimicrobiota bacterium]
MWYGIEGSGDFSLIEPALFHPFLEHGDNAVFDKRIRAGRVLVRHDIPQGLKRAAALAFLDEAEVFAGAYPLPKITLVYAMPGMVRVMVGPDAMRYSANGAKELV